MIPAPLLRLAVWLRAQWWKVSRPVTVGVRTVVLTDDGKVLLVRHTYGRPLWYLPGGGVKRGETLAQAAAREVREETGVRVDPAALRQMGAWSNLLPSKSDHIVVFVADPGTWTDEPKRASEIAERRFVPADELPEGTSRGTRRRLADLDRGGPAVGEW